MRRYSFSKLSMSMKGTSPELIFGRWPSRFSIALIEASSWPQFDQRGGDILLLAPYLLVSFYLYPFKVKLCLSGGGCNCAHEVWFTNGFKSKKIALPKWYDRA